MTMSKFSSTIFRLIISEITRGEIARLNKIKLNLRHGYIFSSLSRSGTIHSVFYLPADTSASIELTR